MAIRKPKTHPQLSDKSQIRVVFGKLAEQGISLKIKVGPEFFRSRVLEEENESVFASFSTEDIERLGIKTNIPLSVVFYYESKEYYCSMRVQGAGKYHQENAIRFQIPETLSIRDDFGLTNFNVSPRVEVTFTNMFGQFCRGLLVNIGSEGIDIIHKEKAQTKELLALERSLDIAFNLEDMKIYCKGTVLYINHVGEELIGIEFQNLDEKLRTGIAKWIKDQTNQKIQKEKSWLTSRLFGKKKKQVGSDDAAPRGPKLADDYPTVLHEGHPSVLLLSRDENTIARIGKCLKRKYGVLVSKGRFGNVRLIVGFYKPELVLISSALGTISGFDLAGTITDQIPDAPAMIMLGEEQDSREGAHAAAEKGALGYWSIEPFRPLSFFKSVEDTFQLLLPDPEDQTPDQAPAKSEPPQSESPQGAAQEIRGFVPREDEELEELPSAPSTTTAKEPEVPEAQTAPAKAEPAAPAAEPEEEIDPELLGIIDLQGVTFFDN